jgi:ADP-ribose pyrophosphatase YjhB (NUDIX family)
MRREIHLIWYDSLVKPIKHAISVIIQDAAGKTLFALRSPSKREYPNVWSLPSHFMKEGETAQDTVRRIGAHKLGVILEPMELLNEGRVERPDFTLFMHDYSAKTTKGTPSINSDDYIQLQWSEPHKQLNSMEIMGDCCRLYKEFLERNQGELTHRLQ